MPDRSDTLKVGRCPALFKSVFSMTGVVAIADIALTSMAIVAQERRGNAG
jgi:hypothetical protein